jgi:predicted glycosyltransferase involved in capsule biosynthesis
LASIKLEVIAIVKDRPEIEQCVESLFSIKSVNRITICDGGSTDAQCIASLQKLAHKCDRVSILNFPTTGFNKSKLLNHAIAQSNNELLLISDADIIWNQDAVDKLVSKAVVNTICYVQDVEESQPQSVAVKRDRYTYNIHTEDNIATIEIVPWSEHSSDLRPGCGLICTSKSTLISLGGYKEIFTGWGWEDQDLLIRAKLLGIKISTDGKVIHLSHDDTKRNQYCNNLQPSQTRNRNIITCLTSLSQGALLGDLPIKNHSQPKPHTVSFQLPVSLTKDLTQ